MDYKKQPSSVLNILQLSNSVNTYHHENISRFAFSSQASEVLASKEVGKLKLSVSLIMQISTEFT